MGNCVFKAASGIPNDTEEGGVATVVTPNGGVMELHAPVEVRRVTDEFAGHAIYHHASRRHSPPLLHHEVLLPGYVYYLLPLTANAQQSVTSIGQTTPYRMSFGKMTSFGAEGGFVARPSHGGVWKVRLVISPEQLAEILAGDAATEELIESVRTVAKCGHHHTASSRDRSSAADSSDQWSLASSWKAYVSKSSHTGDQ